MEMWNESPAAYLDKEEALRNLMNIYKLSISFEKIILSYENLNSNFHYW